MTARKNRHRRPIGYRTRGPSAQPCLETDSVPTEVNAEYYLRARRTDGGDVILEAVAGPLERAEARGELYARHLEGYSRVWVEEIQLDNYQQQQKAARDRTKCSRGHVLTPENTRVCVDARCGGKVLNRVCRTCERARAAEKYVLKKLGWKHE